MHGGPTAAAARRCAVVAASTARRRIAGIAPGDTHVAVDGQTTQGTTCETMAALLAGPEGTAVILSWRGRDGARTATLVRGDGAAGNGAFAQRVGDLLVLRITGFSQHHRRLIWRHRCRAGWRHRSRARTSCSTCGATAAACCARR